MYTSRDEGLGWDGGLLNVAIGGSGFRLGNRAE